MGWMRYLRGVPDVDETQPKIRKIGAVARLAGEKFASWTRLDRFAAWSQKQANKNPRRFGLVLIAICVLLLALNIFRIYQSVSSSNHASMPNIEALRQHGQVHQAPAKIQTNKNNKQ